MSDLTSQKISLINAFNNENTHFLTQFLRLWQKFFEFFFLNEQKNNSNNKNVYKRFYVFGAD